MREKNSYSPRGQRVDFTPSGKPTTHGKRSTYNRGCRCEKCFQAQKEYQEAGHRNRRLALAAGLIEVNHGTTNAYWNYACRCEPCKAAGAAKNKRDSNQRAAGYVREFKKPDLLVNAKQRRLEEFRSGKRKIKHGTANGYQNYNCRCDKCRDWQKHRKNKEAEK